MAIRASRVSWVVAMSLLSSCWTSIDVARLGSGPARPPVPIDSVRLFFSPDYVGTPFEPVALLGTGIDWTGDFNDDVYRTLRARAGQLGANAVLIGPVVDAQGRPRISGLPERTTQRNVGRAVAIYVSPPG
jgi:hypothetical protein